MSARVTVLIFSGRPNPSWNLDDKHTSNLIKHWNDLPATEVRQAPTSRLGYQGCKVDLNSVEYFILCDGSGIFFKDDKPDAQKIDTDRKLERKILETAPKEFQELILQLVHL